MRVRKSSPCDTVITLYVQKWEKKYYPETYEIIWGFDRKMANEIVGVKLEKIAERLDVYLAHPFYESCRHSLAAFVKNFNNFIPVKKVRKSDQRTCEHCGMKFDSASDYYKHKCPQASYPKEFTEAMTKLTEQMKP